MQLKICLLGLIVLLSYSCKTPQNFTPDSFQGSMITFGSEGGFAGTTAENYIFENGQFYSYESKNGALQELGTIEKTVVKQLFDNFTTLGFDKLELNDPGNLSYYIKMKTGEEEKVIRWGGMNEETPPLLKQYFLNLGQIARKYKIVTQ